MVCQLTGLMIMIFKNLPLPNLTNDYRYSSEDESVFMCDGEHGKNDINLILLVWDH